jgi:hypothetical protein
VPGQASDGRRRRSGILYLAGTAEIDFIRQRPVHREVRMLCGPNKEALAEGRAACRHDGYARRVSGSGMSFDAWRSACPECARSGRLALALGHRPWAVENSECG